MRHSWFSLQGIWCSDPAKHLLQHPEFSGSYYFIVHLNAINLLISVTGVELVGGDIGVDDIQMYCKVSNSMALSRFGSIENHCVGTGEKEHALLDASGSCG